MANLTNELKGRTMVVGQSWWNRGQVYEVFSAREADEKGEMPDGAVLVLRDGDLAIPEETIVRAVAILIEQNDISSHVVRLCANHHVPCVVNLPGLCDLFHWRDYVEVDSRKGIIKKIRPGIFTSTSTYRPPSVSSSPSANSAVSPPKKSFLAKLLSQ